MLDQFFHYLLVEKGLSKKTLEAYSHDLHRFVDFLHHKGIKDVRGTIPPHERLMMSMR